VNTKLKLFTAVAQQLPGLGWVLWCTAALQAAIGLIVSYIYLFCSSVMLSSLYMQEV
jgi:hypothetical protein